MKSRTIFIFSAVQVLFFHTMNGVDFQVSGTMDAKLKQYMKDTASAPYANSLCVTMFSYGWTFSFDAALPSAATGDYATGKKLPPEIAAIAHNKLGNLGDDIEKLTPALISGSNTIITNQTEMDAYSALAAGFGGALNNRTDSLPSLLSARLNMLPPRKGDVVIYRIASVLQRDDDTFFTTATDGQMQAWSDLAKAKNPIYRLIAAQTFPKVISRSQKALLTTFYTNFGRETDPDICKEVINLLMSFGYKEHAAIISAIESTQRGAGNTEVADFAKAQGQVLGTTGK